MKTILVLEFALCSLLWEKGTGATISSSELPAAVRKHLENQKSAMRT